MTDTCPTVKIKTASGPVIINESDFDPKLHKLYAAKADAAPAPETDAPASDDVAPEPAEPDMAALRAEYERIVGKRPWNGWDAERLLSEIDKAKAE